MAKTGADNEVDKLFQLPLGEFTAARNALAKASGKEGASIRELSKPPVAAWAVNQLYWHRRKDYEALIEASADMRRTHKAVIEGKRGDLRSAGHAHDKALETALKSTLALLKEGGHPVTDATRQQILNTLRALPSDEAPGRLTRALAPGGFELLAGVKPAKPAKADKSAKATEKEDAETPKAASKAEKQSAKEKVAREAAERAVREAEQRARRAEFEAARAVREAERAAKRAEETEAAVEQARQDLADAEATAATAKREATATARARETAERKVRDAESALDAARARLKS
jgi:hypothetical protein